MIVLKSDGLNKNEILLFQDNGSLMSVNRFSKLSGLSIDSHLFSTDGITTLPCNFRKKEWGELMQLHMHLFRLHHSAFKWMESDYLNQKTWFFLFLLSFRLNRVCVRVVFFLLKWFNELIVPRIPREEARRVNSKMWTNEKCHTFFFSRASFPLCGT